MSNINYLRSIGLTNHQSESYGDLASGKPIIYSAAFCACGFHTRKTSLDHCSSCGKTLFWQTLPLAVIQSKEFAQRRVKAKRLVLETLNNVACQEVLRAGTIQAFWGPNHPNREGIPVSALSIKLRQSLSIESVEWDFTTSSVIIYTTAGAERVFQKSGPR